MISNGKVRLTLTTLGATLASIVLSDNPAKLNPLWDPVRIAREQGREVAFNGSAGHFVCVDGFGPASADERAAGMPMHGEAHVTRFEMSRVEERSGSAVTFTATLPIVQELFTRTYHVVKGENVVYVDSQLENLMGVRSARELG